ncbi:LacI family DNA-binding transcriptional regulator [Streptomyces sp. NPDC059740]|uniref:LacI family DNA-binding transcriptional regulator n=1 Tax=Streptomyces sp. NPDC059740 TaxID=3346926 RepID=UPI003660E284
MTDVTLREVARLSGCSVSTVSRVLSGNRPVGSETAGRVRAAAESLGYVPNQVARSLRSRSTGTVGLVLPQIANPYYPALVRELTRALLAGGRAALLADCDDDSEAEAARVADLLGRRVDALLVIPVDEHRSRATVADAAARVPLVLLDRGCGPQVADSVAVDHGVGIAMVMEHLAATGRRRPAFVGAAGNDSAAAERAAAYTAGLAHFPQADPGAVELGDFSVEWGRAAVDRLRPLRHDAVVCANDLIAIGVIQRLRERGADVPGDVAVTGFDDIPMARLTVPALTTVRQPVRELAAEAAALLDRQLSGQAGGARRSVRLTPELVVRASTVHPPVADAALPTQHTPRAGSEADSGAHDPAKETQ